MIPLNLPPAQLKIKKVGAKSQVFDIIRKRFVALTPEEWVRQNFLHYLIHHKNYPSGLIAVEMPVAVNSLKQRADIVVHNRMGTAVVVIECKAPSVKITKMVFDQAARYNMQLDVNYLIVSNGLQHYCAQLTNKEGAFQIVSEIPNFDIL